MSDKLINLRDALKVMFKDMDFELINKQDGEIIVGYFKNTAKMTVIRIIKKSEEAYITEIDGHNHPTEVKRFKANIKKALKQTIGKGENIFREEISPNINI